MLLPLITFGVSINDKNKYIGLYDPGANISFITLKCVRKLNLPIQGSEMTFRTIGGRHGFAGRVTLKLKVMEVEKYVKMFIVKDDNFKYDILLGLDLIVDFFLNLDCELNLYQTPPSRAGNEEKDTHFQNSDGIRDIYVNYNEGIDVTNFEAKVEHLDYNRKNAIENLIDRFKAVFAKDKFDVGRVKDHEAHIKLFEHKIVSRKPYRCSIPDQLEIENQITQLIKADLIEESTSPFASPVTLALKKEDNKKIDCV